MTTYFEELIRAYAVNDDLRRRVAELGNALKDGDPEAYAAITPMRTTGRANRILTVLATVQKWRTGDASDADLQDAVDHLSDYLPEWQRQRIAPPRDTSKATEARRASAARKRGTTT